MCDAGLQGEVQLLTCGRVQREREARRIQEYLVRRINGNTCFCFTCCLDSSRCYSMTAHNCRLVGPWTLHTEGLLGVSYSLLNQSVIWKITQGDHSHIMSWCPTIYLQSQHFSLIKQPHRLNKWNPFKFVSGTPIHNRLSHDNMQRPDVPT